MTLGKPDVSAQARLDLGAQVRWLRLHADRHIARNFAVSATQTFLKIASQPGLGAEVHS